jgi:hypothetical protein
LAGRLDAPDFLEVVRGALGPEWQPFVEVRERNGERTAVFARNAGKNAELLVATLDEEDAVLVQMRVRPEKMAKLVDQPHKAGHIKSDGAPEVNDGPPSFGF